MAPKSHKPKPTSMHDQLCFAIEEKRLIEFDYQDRHRVAEPHDYGMINGVEQLLVYQVGGESRSSKLPDWRLMRVAGINHVKILGKPFIGGRSVPSGKHKQWDRLFARVSQAT